MNFISKITPTTLLRGSLIIIVLAAASGCGQKGPLVLEQIPVDQTQAPLENSIDKIPLETAAEAAADEKTTNEKETESE